MTGVIILPFERPIDQPPAPRHPLKSSPEPTRPPIALVAVDDGPRSTLEPLAGHWAVDLPEIERGEVELEQYWREVFARAGTRLVVVGTSNSARGRRVESAARHAAARIGLPIAAIEDYPGNFRELLDCPTRLLIVESAFSERVYRARPAAPPPIAVIAPVRYDRRRGRAQSAIVPQAPYAVLWAGQPETNACIATLEWLLPQLAGLPAQLIFRAHPRDPAFGSGIYRELFARAGIECLDVSAEPVETTLARRLDLVVTQFSSVAVDAGFAGVPSLHVLLPHAGGGLLRRLKGYDIPAICDAGAAFLATGGPRDDILRVALLDPSARKRVMARFRSYYATDAPTVQLVAAALRDIML